VQTLDCYRDPKIALAANIPKPVLCYVHQSLILVLVHNLLLYVNTLRVMKFIVRNQAKIANKYIRFVKWKLYNLNEEFKQIIYSEIYVKKETDLPPLYAVTVKVGIPGHDIVINERSRDLKQLWTTVAKNIKRQLIRNNQRSRR